MDSSIKELISSTLRIVAPPPQLNISEWADRYRQLSSEASAEPGRWRTSKAEYQRGIMDALLDPGIEQIVVMSSAQVGKSEMLLNALGYFVHLSPCPVLFLQPTLEMAESFSKDRLAPMLRDTKVLAEIIEAPKSRLGSNTLLYKKFKGGQIALAGANSPSSLASRPVRVLLCDEIDRYPLSAGSEGDPINLAKKRTTTFHNRKILLTSTPTVKGASRIELAYEQSDQRSFLVPCPSCQEFQSLIWANIKWEDSNPNDAVYICKNCSFEITEANKASMVSKGVWYAKSVSKGIAGFHLNELYSPWRTWGEIVEDFLRAKVNEETLKTWVNTSLGETWEQRGEAPEWKRLYDRREKYQIGTVPNGVNFLTAGVDIQADRIEVEVVGWGENKVSWSIEYFVFHGQTTTEDPWNQLASLLQKEWTCKGGNTHKIKMMAVDSGFNTQTVYSWCKSQRTKRVRAIKGVAKATTIIRQPSAVDLNSRGKSMRRGFKVWPLGVDMLKSELYGWLNLESPLDGDEFSSGYCQFPQYDEEYFKQLTAEHQVAKVVKGYKRYEWQKSRARNEALDCRIYARAAASMCGLDRVVSSSKKIGPQKRTSLGIMQI